MSKRVPFGNLILVIWCALVVVSTLFSFVTVKQDLSPHYDTMIEASNLAKKSMDEIKKYKLDNGIELAPGDKLQTGMIGYGIGKEYGEHYKTSITTTEGVPEAKRTCCDPNWATVIVSMFVKAGLRKGDQAIFVFSGSFPAMNLCVLSAAQAYGLDYCVMASIGASTYGANDPNFTFFDMVEHLCDINVLTHRIDYVSLGGNDDIGSDFTNKQEKQAIVERLQSSSSTFIYQENFEKNIKMRWKYLSKEVPNAKFMLNVGGSMVGIGTGLDAFIQSGYYSTKNNNAFASLELTADSGLIHYARSEGLPVANMINIKGLCADYGIAYDPDVLPAIGEESGCTSYYDDYYDPTLPIITLILSIGILIFYYLHKKHNGVERRKNERNYILCRR